MDKINRNIDILENTLRKKGTLLDILLFDNTTKKNIIWATDSYEDRGKEFNHKTRILPDLVTGKYGLLIQPRAAKSLEEQRRRTKDKAEVFTPLKVIEQINKSVDVSPNKDNWQEYVRELKLEITCGEAPFIVTRYNPTAHFRKIIELKNRVGFLDNKLKIVSKYCNSKKEWLFWAKEAFKASYGYEWQGDNILLARENLLYTFIDYYKAKFKQVPNIKIQEEFAEIISWNIFQMDGIKYVIPMSCHHEIKIIKGVRTLFEEKPDTVEKFECEGCKYNRFNKHNGKYVKIMDWNKNKTIKFIEIPDDKNPLPAMYLQSIIIKTTSLLQSIGSLVYIGQISDAQILMRVLVEIKINLDYLFILVKKEGDKAFLRVFISETVHKNKLVNSVDWGKDYKKKFKNCDRNIAELKNCFSKDEYKKIKNNGFYDCNLEERAKLTKNSKWYNNVYGQYSQNIHNLDMHEILAQKNNDHFYLSSRKKALLAMLPLCASSIFITCSKIKKLTKI